MWNFRPQDEDNYPLNLKGLGEVQMENLWSTWVRDVVAYGQKTDLPSVLPKFR